MVEIKPSLSKFRTAVLGAPLIALSLGILFDAFRQGLGDHKAQMQILVGSALIIFCVSMLALSLKASPFMVISADGIRVTKPFSRLFNQVTFVSWGDITSIRETSTWAATPIPLKIRGLKVEVKPKESGKKRFLHLNISGLNIHPNEIAKAALYNLYIYNHAKH